MSLLESLIIVSEKAANIARLCRQEEKLFELLVQEKSESEANPRFLQDFKTLADVLIQETVRCDIGKKFPEMKDDIRGEENNTFENTLGEKVIVQISENPEQTKEMLEKVLDGNIEAAKLLTNDIYANIALEEINTIIPTENINLDCSTLGIWIDPIDSTSEYIAGKEERHGSGIYTKGLQCVTVLIGVYSKITGVPVVGVLNQPFYQNSNLRWSGRCFWGVATTQLNSLSPFTNNTLTNVVCISSSEDEKIKKKLLENNFSTVEAAGAGYKLLVVILGLVDAYVLSKGTTFMWDTCGCQAIIMSLGGDIVQCCGNQSSIVYKNIESGDNKIELCCHSNGIIAARNVEVLSKLKEILQSN